MHNRTGILIGVATFCLIVICLSLYIDSPYFALLTLVPALFTLLIVPRGEA